MLTTEQYAALKAHILATPELDAFPNNPDGAFEIKNLLNMVAEPAWVVWRTAVTRREILQNGFDWTRLDNLSVGKARVWSDIFVDGIINPSKPNVRAGIESVWVGTSADLAVRAAVYAHCKKNATRIQKLFSTGTGSDASPAKMGEGITETFQLTYNDVDIARNS